MSKELTNEQKKKYLESGYNGCPKCGSYQYLQYRINVFESDGKQAWRKYDCTACGITFEDIYTLTDVTILSFKGGK